MEANGEVANGGNEWAKTLFATRYFAIRTFPFATSRLG
jgi:hypothetical protein